MGIKNLDTQLETMYMGPTTKGNNMKFPQKIEIELLYNPAILLGVCPKERKTEF